MNGQQKANIYLCFLVEQHGFGDTVTYSIMTLSTILENYVCCAEHLSQSKYLRLIIKLISNRLVLRKW